MITAYGLTESSGTVTMCRPSDDAETIATTSGRAIPGVEVRCVGEDGRELPRGEPGEVLVRGYNVMRGYLDDPEETAKAIDAEGWLHTGDVGVMDARGYLRITDRIKDMFIVGGFNCYPAEIENLMYGQRRHRAGGGGRHPRRAHGRGRHGVRGARARARRSRPRRSIAWCREHMANYKVPRRVEIVAALPQNASGKVLKFELRQRAAASA